MAKALISVLAFLLLACSVSAQFSLISEQYVAQSAIPQTHNMAVLSPTRFVVTWKKYNNNVGFDTCQVQMMDSAGSKVGGVLDLGETAGVISEGQARCAAIRVADNRAFITYNSAAGVLRGVLVDESGAFVSAVDPLTTTGYALWPHGVCADEQNIFVAFLENGTPIYKGVVVNVNGTVVVPPFQISQTAYTGGGSQPIVRLVSPSSVIVAWRAVSGGVSRTDARFVNFAGSPVTNEFTVFTDVYNIVPNIVVFNSNRILVSANDGTVQEIKFQTIDASGNLVGSESRALIQHHSRHHYTSRLSDNEFNLLLNPRGFDHFSYERRDWDVVQIGSTVTLNGWLVTHASQFEQLNGTLFALTHGVSHDSLMAGVATVTGASPGTTATTDPAASCSCPLSLTVDYQQDRVPDAAKNAFATIALNENTWEVEFDVHDVLSITNGHIIVGKPNTRETAATAFGPLVQAYSATELWNPPADCTLGANDQPVSTSGVTVVYQPSNCTRRYRIVYSLVNAGNQNTQRCTLDQSGDDLSVTCNLTLSSVRAYDLTEPTAFLSSETSFSASITLPRNLNNNVSDLLYATLAKCNVLNSPDFAIDCRVPGVWNFDTTFAVSQNIPDWINAASCASTTTTVATFVRCDLNSVPVTGYTEANANVTATVSGSNGQQLTFSLEYTLPRAASATASASLQNFIVSIGMLNEKYYYAGADRATLLIETFDTSRLAITQLEMFNANGQVYDLRGYPQFQLSESNNATHFIIEFRPSAIRQDSAFYRNGPHGVNVSFLFTAASTSRRQLNLQEGGNVVVNGIRVKGEATASAASPSGSSGGSAGSPAVSSTVIIAAAAGVAVLAVGAIAAAVIVSKRRGAARREAATDAAAKETVSAEQV